MSLIVPYNFIYHDYNMIITQWLVDSKVMAKGEFESAKRCTVGVCSPKMDEEGWFHVICGTAIVTEAYSHTVYL